MRIFFITNNYTPYTGGVTQSIITTTDALRAQGHEVFIITLNFDGDHHDDPDYVIRIPCPLQFTYKKNPMAIPWRPTHVLTELIKQYKPDIIHLHHPFLLGVSGLRAARALQVRCVFTYHTLYHEYAHYVPLLAQYTQLFIAAYVTRFCNKVDGIIAPSNAIAEYLIAQKIHRPITVIPSALRPAFTATDDGDKVSDGNINLLLVSRCVPEKNIPFVFDVIQQLPHNYKLTIVGYGTDYEKLQHIAFEQRAIPRTQLQFIHKPPLPTLLNTYRTAHLFLFPSQTDTQGLVLAESMSQKVPVIALPGPGQQDIIIDGVNGFIIHNAQQAAHIITSIAHDNTLYTQLCANAYATSKQYHANPLITRLLDFYTMRLT
jgi:1,2-diacylglycerol 3-alpha-glucosyltransferase